MARMISSALINDIRGSMGSMVFDNWKGVQVIRRKSISRSNPSSREQSDMRARITDVSKRWSWQLTQAQRDGWNHFAKRSNDKESWPKTGSSGLHEHIPESKGPKTGYNEFLKLNALGFSADVIGRTTHILDAPNDNPPPGMHTGLDAGWNPGTCSIILEWSNPVVMLANTRTRVWIHSLAAGVHLQIQSTKNLTQQTATITTIRIAGGKTTVIRKHPGIYICQIDAIGPDGQKGPSSEVISIAVPVGCVP